MLSGIFNPSARAQPKALRTFKPDVVHLLMFMTQASPPSFRSWLIRPVVYTTNTYRVICPTGTRLLPNGSLCTEHPGRVCRSNGCLSSKGWLPRMVQLQLLEKWRENIRCVVAPSAAMAKELELGGWPVSKIIYYGVEQHQRSSGLAERPCIAYAGRLVPEKGCRDLLHAFARVLTQHPDAQLLIAGDGPERARLQALAIELVGGSARVSGPIATFRFAASFRERLGASCQSLVGRALRARHSRSNDACNSGRRYAHRRAGRTDRARCHGFSCSCEQH